MYEESPQLPWSSHFKKRFQGRKALKKPTLTGDTKKIFNTIYIHQSTIRDKRRKAPETSKPTKTSYNYLFYGCKLQVLKIYAHEYVANIQWRIFAAPVKATALSLHIFAYLYCDSNTSVHIRWRICMIIFILHSLRLFFFAVCCG